MMSIKLQQLKAAFEQGLIPEEIYHAEVQKEIDTWGHNPNPNPNPNPIHHPEPIIHPSDEHLQPPKPHTAGAAYRYAAQSRRRSHAHAAVEGCDVHIAKLLEGNRAYVQACKELDPHFFEKLRDGQHPPYLYIGCSDSRVPSSQLMGLHAGEVFTHRNVANLVIASDMSLMSVLEYGIFHLGVTDLIICGHTKCGGVKAASCHADNGLLEHWLRTARDALAANCDELSAIEDDDARWDRAVEVNVVEQCLNLHRTPIVQRKLHEGLGIPRIHAMVYDVPTGTLKNLSVDFHNLFARSAEATYALFPDI